MIFSAILYLTLAVSTTFATPVKRALRFPYDSQKIRGVNIGGWLVTEPFITPDLYDATNDQRIIDEWTFGQYQNRSVALAALQQHWSTFITEDDFAQIAAAGLNHVRIPIGYWAFDISAGEPYIKDAQYDYLKQAVGWAANHGLYVLVDLHGAPGSQNGFDNSGRTGSILWHTQQSYINRTNAIIQTLAAEFAQDKYASSVAAIAPLNEPAGFASPDLLNTVRQYWYDSYGNIRVHSADIVEVIHDSFQPLSYWSNFTIPTNSSPNVMLDTHHYEIFSDGELAMDYQQHISTACSHGNDIASWANTPGNLWTVVGEWVTTPYDCAKYLNGRGKGARYDGTFAGSTYHGTCAPFTGSSDNFPDYYKTFMRQYFEAQTSSFEGGNGWIFWTWKAAPDEWSYSKGLEGGWIPRDPTERLYPNVCG